MLKVVPCANPRICRYSRFVRVEQEVINKRVTRIMEQDLLFNIFSSF